MGWIKVIQSLGLLSPNPLSIQLKYVYIECIIFLGRITKWIKHMQYLSLSKLSYALLVYSALHKHKGVLHYFMHMEFFKHLWNAATSIINLLSSLIVPIVYCLLKAESLKPFSRFLFTVCTSYKRPRPEVLTNVLLGFGSTADLSISMLSVAVPGYDCSAPPAL